MPKNDRSGWVLAGGASTRMGLDKALLEVNGQPMILLAAARAAEVCGTVSIVGDPALYGNLGFPVIPDQFPGAGPLAGIEAALGATRTDWNLIVACDMPALEPAVLERLFSAGAECVLPEYPDGKVEPLCAVYHRRCHAGIVIALEQGIRKVTDALAHLSLNHAITYISVTSAESFANLNTPEELRRYRDG
ncbi:MAG TPA: molybdenum cofactor guanylyltransferase [Bryobacteraceae bacterium]|nr:molybdenum cofactor guanylyltransferase [Bryobacteraceae bacterium]